MAALGAENTSVLLLTAIAATAGTPARPNAASEAATTSGLHSRERSMRVRAIRLWVLSALSARWRAREMGLWCVDLQARLDKLLSIRC